MEAGTSAAIGVESSGMMRLAFGVVVVGSVILVVTLLAAMLWIGLLVAERSRRRAPQVDQLKIRRPFFLSSYGLA